MGTIVFGRVRAISSPWICNFMFDTPSAPKAGNIVCTARRLSGENYSKNKKNYEEVYHCNRYVHLRTGG